MKELQIQSITHSIPFHSVILIFPLPISYRNGSERKRKYRNDYPFRKSIIHRGRKRSIRLRSCLPQSKDRENRQGREARSLSLTAFSGFAITICQNGIAG